EHPAWFIGEAGWSHPVHGAMKILDVSNPEAAAHLKGVISTIVSWGYDLLKVDFLFAGTFDGVHHQEGLTPMGHYAMALELLREAAGEETLLVAVGAPSLETFEWVDGWRIGYDIAVEPFGAAWGFVPNQLRSVGARWPLCRAVLCDADPPLLRDLPREEVEVGIWIAALAGGALFLSDDLRDLPEDRWDWLESDAYELGTNGASAVPLDLFPEAPPEELAEPYVDHLTGVSNHITPRRWRLQDGRMLGINVSDDELTLGETTLGPHSAALLEP
ncbi:MAG: hypothetical protein VX938_08835, partial [Myxococcota bacterium]|nr:hypothetical protein [Myxococcota bacterium]